ncbi:MAG: acyltransferase family protein [Egibacteraceae bacterium]
MHPTQHSAGPAVVTPATRDRYVDLLRATAIGVVVYGHWLMAAVAYSDGILQADNLLTITPQTQYLTWLFQVMPLFFFVGGYANAASWRSATRRGVGYTIWLRGRARRLLGPAVVLVGCWAVLLAALAFAGLDPAVLRVGVWYPIGPLWFLMVYLAVVTAVPLTLRLHDRLGWQVSAGLAGLIVATDAARLVLGVPLIAWLNLLWVWMALHQMGYWWQDGRLTRSQRPAWALLAGGGSAAVALVVAGPYPLSMVGVDHQGLTNTTPPTSALLALGLAQIGAALTLRRHAERWLRRPRVWRSVAAVNGMAMTLYLWHLPALVLVTLAVVLPGAWPDPPAGTVLWWALRPFWLAALTLAILPLLALFARVERRAATPAARDVKPS